MDVAVLNEAIYIIDRNNHSIRRIVDGSVYTFCGSEEGDAWNVPLTYRASAKLPPGDYVCKARYYTESGIVLTADIQMIAVGLVTGLGTEIPSTYVEVASDTTTNATLEDIDGLSTTLNVPIEAKVFGALTLSSLCTSKNLGVFAVNIGGEQIFTRRIHDVQNALGDPSVCGTTQNALQAGSHTVKGEWSISGGTMTGSPVALSAVSMGLADNNSLVSEYINIASDSTASTTLADISGSTLNITVEKDTTLFLSLSFSAEPSSGNKNGTIGIEVNGVDVGELQRGFSNANDDASFITFACVEVLAGTHTIKGRWAISGGTMTGSDISLTAIAGLVEPYDNNSSSSSSLND